MLTFQRFGERVALPLPWPWERGAIPGRERVPWASRGLAGLSSLQVPARRFSGGPSHRGPPAAGRVRELPGRGSALARGQITPSARTEMQRRCGFGAQVIADG